ncbi:unnamed protein product [Closterium sp. Naga37s-1]|nr:unnamed protein product [Closterium sp. Naga37s-1]
MAAERLIASQPPFCLAPEVPERLPFEIGRMLDDPQKDVQQEQAGPQQQRGVGIVPFLEGKHVLITGATGFIGKVLVEKILLEQPRVGQMFLLIQPTALATASQRSVRSGLLPPCAQVRCLLALRCAASLRSGALPPCAQVRCLLAPICAASLRSGALPLCAQVRCLLALRCTAFVRSGALPPSAQVRCLLALRCAASLRSGALPPFSPASPQPRSQSIVLLPAPPATYAPSPPLLPSHQVVPSPLFSHLRQRHEEGYEAFMASKLTAVAGNMASDDLDWLQATLLLWRTRYDVALNINTLGPRRLIAFAKQCKQLQLVVHVSTGEAQLVVHVSTGEAQLLVHVSTGETQLLVHVSTGEAQLLVHVSTGGAQLLVHVSTGEVQLLVHVSTSEAQLRVHVSTREAQLLVHVSTGEAKVLVHVSTSEAQLLVHVSTGEARGPFDVRDRQRRLPP